ncbi:large subunit ribosomal protein L13e [Enteropsectra breve]|nr:large subunit ribosomal protein L13e [Enteropsectra breve]
MKRNNAIQTNHFKKTALRYRTWFNQPARHTRRHHTRVEKAKKITPAPLQKLRPVVRCPTIRHNRKIRLGRGFTAEECKEAGLDFHYARTVGIAVDLRRVNNSQEAFEANVSRLQEYLSKITIYKSKEEAVASGAVQHKGVIMPVFNNTPVVKAITPAEVASYN